MYRISILGKDRFHSRSQQPRKFIGTKESFTLGKSSTPTGLVWYTNMAAVSLFWYTNMAAVTSCENDLLNRNLLAPEIKGMYQANLIRHFNGNKKKIVKFCYKLSPQCNKCVDQRQSLKNVRLFQVLAIFIPKCATTGHELILSRIELLSFLSLLGNI